MPRFGLNGATTGDRVDLMTDIHLARAAGYHGVELRDTKIARYLNDGRTLTALRELLRSTGVDVLSINALEDATLPTGAAFETIMARCKTLCAWARELGSPYIVAVPSFLQTGREPGGGPSQREVRERSAAALGRIARVAAEFDVQVGFEFLGFPSCSVSTLREARGIVDDVGDPRVGLVIDAFHFYIGGSQPEDLDGIEGTRIFLVHLDDAERGEPAHLTDAHRLLPGEGVISLRALIGRLQAAGYRGAYSLELFRPEYWTWNPSALARHGLESMQTLFDSATPA